MGSRGDASEFEEFASEPGKGTTFEIYLPRAEAGSSVSKAPPRQEAAQRGDETLLLIEDEKPVRMLCAHALEQLGYTVISAAAGSKGLERAAGFEGSIDALVMDVVLPDMRGPEIAERLRKLRPDIAVLFTSGYARDAIEHVRRNRRGHLVGRALDLLLGARLLSTLDRQDSRKHLAGEFFGFAQCSPRKPRRFRRESGP